MRVMTYLVIFLSALVTFSACAPSRGTLKGSESLSGLDTLIDGVTTKVQITNQLASPINSFEGGRILIFMWMQDYNKPCHVVTVFDENDVLQKHSVIEVR